MKYFCRWLRGTKTNDKLYTLTTEELIRLIEDSVEFEIDSDSNENEMEDFERNKQMFPEIQYTEQ